MTNSGNTDRPQEEQSGSGRGRPGEQDGLRLIQAFRAIPDPKVRRTIVELVENVSRALARRSREL